MSISLLDNVIENLKILTGTIEVKYINKASKDETLDKTKAFDYYHLALTKQDSFSSYPKFNEEALILSGIQDDTLLSNCIIDKNEIPTTMRNLVVENQRLITIRDFEEMNNYYRTFIGLPATNDTEHFYITKELSELFDIDISIPIHKLKDIDLLKIQGVGYISKLVSENPKKEYLKYIGNNRLNLYNLRMSRNLSIIKIDKKMVPDKLFIDFMDAYGRCREYFMSAVYIKEYGYMYKYYDNVIGFMTIVSAIRHVMTKIFKNGIDRDFYDEPSIVKMFDAYNIPFIRQYTIEQHRIVLRNINNLIRVKGTDRVILDLVTLLGFSDVNVFKYYLVKSHKKDIDGNPVFAYKDEIGRGLVQDKEKMYNLNFVRVDIDEKNIGAALSNHKNYMDYGKVTDKDPFWWDDGDLKNAIYDNEFNFIETKYISFEIIYKMSRVIFESVFFLSMLHDRKEETSRIELFFNKVNFSKPIDLFNITILIIALIAKKQHLKGEIIHDPTMVGHIMGFNFKKDLSPIIEDIKNDRTINDPELISYISNMSISNINDIDILYKNIKGFKGYIERKLYYCNDRTLYFKYKDIYNNIMTTGYMSELFRLPDGDIASTYKEYLLYTNYDLYKFLDEIEEGSIDETLLHIYSNIQEYCQNILYLHQTGEGVSINAEALMKLVNYFKSYTVDIEQFNIIYIIDDRMDTIINLIEQHEMTTTSVVGVDIAQYDSMKYRSNLHESDRTKMTVYTAMNTYTSHDDMILVQDNNNPHKIDILLRLDKVNIDTESKISNVYTKIYSSDNINVDDNISTIISLFEKDRITISDKKYIMSKLRTDINLDLVEWTHIVSHIHEIDSVINHDSISVTNNTTLLTYNDTHDEVSIKSSNSIIDNHMHYDTCTCDVSVLEKDKLHVRDCIKIVYI